MLVRVGQIELFALLVVSLSFLGRYVNGENFCSGFNPCKNMADCLRRDDDPSRVRCVCKRGFNGNLCEIWPKSCNPDFCFNGGTCVIIRRIPRCLCQPEYKGLFCENASANKPATLPPNFQQNAFGNRFQANSTETPSYFPFQQQQPQQPAAQNFQNNYPTYTESSGTKAPQFPAYEAPVTTTPVQAPTTMPAFPNPQPQAPSSQIFSYNNNFQPEVPPDQSNFQGSYNYMNMNYQTGNRRENTICDYEPCLNYGNCIPITNSNALFKFRCVCPEFYAGILCENYYPPANMPSREFVSSNSEGFAFQPQQVVPFPSQYNENSQLPPAGYFTEALGSFTTPIASYPSQTTVSQTLEPVTSAPSIATTTKKVETTTESTTSTTTSTTTTPKPTTTTTTTTTTMTTTQPTFTTTTATSLPAFVKSEQQAYVYTTTAVQTEKKMRKYSLCSQLRPCANNGQCIDNDKSGDNVQKFKCICKPEFTGVFCHIKIRTRSNVCAYNLCLNSGECVPSRDNNSFSCSCPPEFTGKFCEIKLYN